MHTLILFYNIGPYHLARLESARAAVESIGGRLSAMQIAATTSEHPWGGVELPDYVTTLEPYQPGGSPRLGNPKLLTDALDRLRPDVVAVPGWGFDFSRKTLSWCIRNNATRVLMSESHYDDAPRRWWKEKLKSLLWVRRFHSALVGGVRHVDYLKSLQFPAEKIFLGYDVVDNDSFARDVDRARMAGRPSNIPSTPYFLASSRFISRKNLKGMIVAYAAARGRSQEPLRQDLVILGDGPQKSELQEEAQRQGVASHVHFPGFLTRDQVNPWLAFADAFVHPASHEQWGLVVNEAMAAGLPVAVSRNCGCFPELVVEGVTGFGFAPESIDEMAECFRKLGELGDRRAAMGAAARTHLNSTLPASRFGQGLVQAIQSTR